MTNPWNAIGSTPPFMLDCDAEIVERFNRRASDRVRLQLDLFPEPFQGSPQGSVVLLGLNPGVVPGDAAIHARPEMSRLLRANLVHEPVRYPFYLLNPEVTGPGRAWWEQKLAAVLKIVPRELVAARLLSVEYSPYHSERFGHHPMLPSQEYGFHLVRQAVLRGAVVVVMRSLKLWRAAVPELIGYHRAFTLRSVQNVTISPGNCPDGFGLLIEALRQDEARKAG